jgi:dephospho-CoA kinase
MYRVAITGNIGAGKSTVAKLFEKKGIPVFNSDLCGRESENDPEIHGGYKRILGEEIYHDGVLDRTLLREIIFTNKEILKEINELVTAYIKRKFEEFCQKHSNSKIVMLESAVIFENGVDNNFDCIITVTASEDVRIERAMKRDGSSLKEVKNKLNNQMLESYKVNKSRYVIVNEGQDLIDNLDILEKQVDAVYKALNYDEEVNTFIKYKK